jgi:hypothetical protein
MTVWQCDSVAVYLQPTLCSESPWSRALRRMLLAQRELDKPAR